MWFDRLGEYINRGWKEAALIALLFSFIPFLGWVAVVIMALMTMRKGAQAGLLILWVTCLPSVVLLSLGMNSPWAIAVLVGNTLAWILAQVLRRTADWSKVLFYSMIAVFLVAVVVHGLLPDLRSYWLNVLHHLYQETDKEAARFLHIPPGVSLQKYLRRLANAITPMFITMQLLMALVNLLIARAWQARLYNPGGLIKELYQIRLSPWAFALFAVVIGMIYFGMSLGWDIFPSMVVMFFLAGLVVSHKFIRFRNINQLFLWLFYGLIVLLLPYSIIAVAGLGIMHTFIDFRAKDASSTKDGES